jgi:hypothetical protein
MSLLINCPQGAALQAIPIVNCPEAIGQIQKVVFQRIKNAAGGKNKFVIATNDPAELATWTPVLAAADATKVVPSPYIQAPVFEAGAAREYGGGNETLGGMPIVIGREPSTFTGNILRAAQKTIEALKTYQVEEVGVFLLDEFSRIIGLVDDHTTPTEFYPIPISSLFVGDKVIGGLESVDMNMVSWRFAPNWSDKLSIVVPTDFNALSDLVPAA